MISGACRRPFKKRVARVLTQMATDPFQGNVKALQGKEWKGVFRRRIGDYRLFFIADYAKKLVVIQQISLRSGKTYR
jgi:mRNA-degrading endonuclease RelE of RelBE toxin-antitoxin system